MNFIGSICLTDIPKELIKTGKNGKKYLNIWINEYQNKPQNSDYTHYIKVRPTKDQYELAKNGPYYLGNIQPVDGEAPKRTEKPAAQNEEADDLPF